MSIQRDFEEAMGRIVAQRPSHPQLIAEARRGKCRLTLSAVALEAGHSRVLITGVRCKYPQIREAIGIKTAKKTDGGSAKVGTNVQSLIEIRNLQDIHLALRIENENLENKVGELTAMLEAISAENRLLHARLSELDGRGTIGIRSSVQ